MPLFQQLVPAREVRLGIGQLCLGLLHAGARLFDLRLERPWIDFREQIAELDLLTDLQADRLELAGNFERQKTDFGRLQQAWEPTDAALRVAETLYTRSPRTACSAVSSFLCAAGSASRGGSGNLRAPIPTYSVSRPISAVRLTEQNALPVYALSLTLAICGRGRSWATRATRGGPCGTTSGGTASARSSHSSRRRKRRGSWTWTLYRERNVIERLVGRLKEYRRIATRYDKLAASYLAFVQLAAIRMWL